MSLNLSEDKYLWSLEKQLFIPSDSLFHPSFLAEVALPFPRKLRVL